ncbi:MULTISPECIES: CoA-acylating methylmalonate-semialdehyde dehydrogenase [Streptomyces]|uniref:methylmalonate-semialdehyde dehydrogenase (CoA acylating) n=1 Tax=Streptomyces stelliscabiei TaxID=146820 RepID=A0A8I0TV55_9ACTN|nr:MULTISPECIES: CoA-acylating methylmalonate-semialdehyde dehydrogenase [Streptomyces]KND41537.1 methylmalonate-semialdehyde dehydrogenase [Streptomyces stelliscabiei]MBE1601459.1 malonate-semialdehyde dehydrogenase (acetylating)/methylmalonate-semialdehyde dehydrogenase [Streptomyces stelliscabiei]MDX2515219.1 CoA-acylating methylmalonate-semialdehyde dehydrogenase [Streptomyces stelliscabiei]MDX2555224.1 CoA-acylating methylmalonate-semialdehyde dehydrogenase [Streptomyces stelliscabiei]MDX
MNTIPHWINGSPAEGSTTATQPVHNPATGVERARVVLGGPADVDAAVRAASAAFETWSESSLTTRTQVMFAFRQLLVEHEEELGRIISAEHGKTVDDARGEIVRGREVVEFACGLGDVLKGDFSDQVSRGVDVHSFRQPLGVVAGITPFNFPAMVPLWMHPIALATGNTFILKPSERDPSAANFVAGLYRKAGLPDGVFNVVHGGKDAVDALLAHPGIEAVSFVGSTPIARYVHERATATGKRVQALGGAKNHAVVLPDADLEFAANHITAGAYGSAGERCMALSVAVAVGEAADGLVEVLERKAREVRVGPGDAPGTEMGPLVTRAAQERVENAVGTAAAQGATVVVDGRGLKVAGHEDGFFTGPSLLDHVTTEMEAYRQELFGPVLAVVRVDTLDEAIDVVNANPYGNGTAVFTASGEAARRFQRSVKVGMIGVNVPVPVPMSYYSFGGWKDSLIGDSPVHGPEGIRFYTRPKVVTSRWPRQNHHVAAGFTFPTSD